MSSKQDSIGARTPTDLERKYDLGSWNANFAEVMGVATDARNIAEEAKAAAEEASKPLTPEEAFNALTEGGKWQGLYEDEDGNVYINASYIKSGELNGDLLKVGTIKSKDGTLSIDLENGVLDAFGGLSTNGLNVRSKATDDVDLFEVYVYKNADNRNCIVIAARDENGNFFMDMSAQYEGEGGINPDSASFRLFNTTDDGVSRSISMETGKTGSQISLTQQGKSLTLVQKSDGTREILGVDKINGEYATGFGKVKELANVGGLFMEEGQKVVLSERVQNQNKGIVLAWSGWNYDTGAPMEGDWHYTFIPKTASGNVCTGLMFSASGEYCGFKMVSITDEDSEHSAIVGNHINYTFKDNTFGATYCGIQTRNDHWCLRYVYGV